MQYLTSRNMSSIATPKIHKVVGSPTDTPWMQSSPSNTVSDQYYSSTTNNSTGIATDSDPDNVYMSDTSKSHRSRNSTTDMCVEKNTEGKPPYSYATLIKYAIERSSENKLTLSQIYQWVIDHYPYYGSAGSGWKNSIRHNLSLNKSFVRVPRPVNEPGKGSYWTVDQFAIDTEQRVRTNVRGRSSRSSSDPSLHRASNNSNNNDPWSFGGGNAINRNYRDGRSLSTDASASSSSALRRTSQYGYCSHPYGGYERNFNNQPQYSYPNYHQYGQQRMPSHETLLTARQHSSVTYSLPVSATTTHHYNQSTPFNTNSNNIYSSTINAQQPFYSHRQSCPDLSSISSATYSETNILPNFNSVGTNEVCLEPSSGGAPSSSFGGENKIIYTTTTPSNSSFTTPNSFSATNEHHRLFGSASSPIKVNTRSLNGGGGATTPLSSFFKDQDSSVLSNNNHHHNTPGLPSPVLSPSNCSPTSSKHLSVADPLAMVTQHPSPVTTTAATAATPGNRLTSPYYSTSGLTIDQIHQQQRSSSVSVVEECLTSPSSPLVMTDRNSSPMSTSLDGGLRSPVPFCIDSTSSAAAVAYIDMVSQQQQQNASLIADDNNSLSSSPSSQHNVCSPQPSTTNSVTNESYKQDKYTHMMSDSNTPNTTTNSFIHQNTTDERFDYTNL